MQDKPSVDAAGEKEIAFSGGDLLSLLTKYKNIENIENIENQFILTNPPEIRLRQRFLLTEKPRANKQGCKINLDVSKDSPDGIDGKRGKKTNASTNVYLTWLFEKTHPERRKFVSTILEAKKQREAASAERKHRGSVITAVAKNTVLEKQKKENEIALLKAQRAALDEQKGTQTSEQKTRNINEKIVQLATTIQQKEKTRNLEQEEERATNLFFVITLDGKKVILNESAEELYKSAKKAINEIKTEAPEDQKKIEQEINKIAEEKEKAIHKSDAYRASVHDLQNKGLSEAEATKIADEQTKKAAKTLAIREFSFNITNGTTKYGLSEATCKTIKENKEVAIFNELFERIINIQYASITAPGQLNRALPVPFDPYFETVAKVVVYESKHIQNYLFAKTNHKSIFASQDRSQETKNHLATLQEQNKLKEKTEKDGAPGDQKKKVTKNNQEQEEQQKELGVDLLSNNLNNFTNKRARQLMLYAHFLTCKKLFGQMNTQGVPLQQDCDFSLTDIKLEKNHSFSVPFTYQKLATQLTISGATGQISVPTLFDRFSGKTTVSPLAQITSPKDLEQNLLQTAKLTQEELLLCTSEQEIQELITAKMSKKLLEASPPVHQTKTIARHLEHEALLAHLWGYIDHTHATKRATDTTKQVYKEQDGFLVFIRNLISSKNGKTPLSYTQTKKINNRLSNKEMHHFFSQITKKPGGFETWISDCGLLQTPSNEPPQKIVDFFDALHQMATSQVPSTQEAGLKKLDNLFPSTIPLVGINGRGNSPYIYEDKQLKTKKNHT